MSEIAIKTMDCVVFTTVFLCWIAGCWSLLYSAKPVRAGILFFVPVMTWVALRLTVFKAN